MSQQKVCCPRCQSRLCDRTPAGLAAGHFLCHRCKLELVLEITALCEAVFVIVSREIEAYLPTVTPRRRLSDGRALATWEEFKMHV